MSDSISDLVSIDFNNYPIPDNGQVNKHIRIFFSLNSLYQICLNSFELIDVNEIFTSLFKLLFDGYGNIIFYASKMENESSQKQ